MAVAEQPIDFAKIDLADPLVETGLALRLSSKFSAKMARLHELRFMRTIAVASREDVDMHGTLDSSDRQLGLWRESIFPWISDPALRKAELDAVAQQLETAWVESWGDYADPAIQAKIDQVAARLLAPP